MLSRKYRYSFREGVPNKILNDTFFVVRFKKKCLETPRFAVVVSKKIDKRAVGRNQLKRRITQIIQDVLKEKDISVDMVFYIRAKTKDLTQEELGNHIKQVLKKAVIIEA